MTAIHGLDMIHLKLTATFIIRTPRKKWKLQLKILVQLEVKACTERRSTPILYQQAIIMQRLLL